MIMSITANSLKQNSRKVEVPDGLKKECGRRSSMKIAEDSVTEVRVRQRRGLSNFWGKFKDGIIDLFKEEKTNILFHNSRQIL